MPVIERMSSALVFMQSATMPTDSLITFVLNLDKLQRLLERTEACIPHMDNHFAGRSIPHAEIRAKAFGGWPLTGNKQLKHTQLTDEYLQQTKHRIV
jgi:hypothetical protein